MCEMKKKRREMLLTLTEDALHISTAIHKDTSCECSKTCSKVPSLVGSLTYKLLPKERGPCSGAENSDKRQFPVLKPKILSRSLVGD